MFWYHFTNCFALCWTPFDKGWNDETNWFMTLFYTSKVSNHLSWRNIPVDKETFDWLYEM